MDLGEFTNERLKMSFKEQIKEDSEKWLDKVHMEFLNDNNSLSFEEVLVVKSVFEYLKLSC